MQTHASWHPGELVALSFPDSKLPPVACVLIGGVMLVTSVYGYLISRDAVAAVRVAEVEIRHDVDRYRESMIGCSHRHLPDIIGRRAYHRTGHAINVKASRYSRTMWHVLIVISGLAVLSGMVACVS